MTPPLLCAVPPLPAEAIRPIPEGIDTNRARLLADLRKIWLNHQQLRYKFIDENGEPAQREIVRAAFRYWQTNVGLGVTFIEVTEASAPAEIRIGFVDGDGSWSYIGKDALGIAPTDRTMNFGWMMVAARGGVTDDTALHEIGHALGFPHEHQNPLAGIVWNEPAVYAALARPPNGWDRQKTYHNIIAKIPSWPGQIRGTEWDRDSVMHYPFEAGLILEPERYRREPLIPSGGVSARDVELARVLYPVTPRAEGGVRRLQPYSFEDVGALMPGQQADFLVEPDATAEYVIETHGDVDTVLAVYDSADHVFIKGDDDGGFARNARVRVELTAGRQYTVSIRLYSKYAKSDTARVSMVQL